MRTPSFALLIFLLTAPVLTGEPWIVTKISDTPSEGFVSVDEPYIAWDGGDCCSGPVFVDQLLLYDGFTMVKVPSSYGHRTYHQWGRRCIWSMGSGGYYRDVFYFDGQSTANLSDDDLTDDVTVGIGESLIVWSSYDGFTRHLRADVADIQVTLSQNEPYGDAHVYGTKVAWCEFDGQDYRVFWSDGINTTQIADSQEPKYVCQTSDSHVAWYLTGRDPNDLWLPDLPAPLLLSDGVTTQQLTSAADSAAISGERVVWLEEVDGQFDLFLFDGTTTTQITDTAVKEKLIGMTDQQIAWFQDDDDGLTIVAYDGATIVPVATLDNYFRIDMDGQTIVWDELCLYGQENECGLYVARPAAAYADFDADNDCDVADFANFARCFGGAGQPLSQPDCGVVDMDDDSDVDVTDFAQFARCMSGPAHLPACVLQPVTIEP
jgi:hypothetical protein